MPDTFPSRLSISAGALQRSKPAADSNTASSAGDLQVSKTPEAQAKPLDPGDDP